MFLSHLFACILGGPNRPKSGLSSSVSDLSPLLLDGCRPAHRSDSCPLDRYGTLEKGFGVFLLPEKDTNKDPSFDDSTSTHCAINSYEGFAAWFKKSGLPPTCDHIGDLGCCDEPSGPQDPERIKILPPFIEPFLTSPSAFFRAYAAPPPVVMVQSTAIDHCAYATCVPYAADGTKIEILPTSRIKGRIFKMDGDKAYFTFPFLHFDTEFPITIMELHFRVVFVGPDGSECLLETKGMTVKVPEISERRLLC